MKAHLWTVLVAALALPGCGPARDGGGSGSGSDDDDSVAELVPLEGAWSFTSGTWLSDECEAVFLSTAIGSTLSDATESGFDLSIEFEESDSLPAETSCTLDAGEYSCDPVVQEFSVGQGAIVLEAGSRGTFSSESAANFEVTFDIECSGSDCDSLLSVSPCTSVQSFDASFDG